MPELPDLQIVTEVLQKHVCGLRIQHAQVIEPLVLRCVAQDVVETLQGNAIEKIRRRGKFLIFDLSDQTHLVFHPMLAGRFQYCRAAERPRAGLCLRIGFCDQQELRYYDRRRMGRIYWVGGSDFASVPQFAGLGPEADDPALNLEMFRKRIRRHPGMIKNVLTNQRFLAGIGNAYADEILFAAGILPFRRRPGLSDQEIAGLYRAMGSVLSRATAELRKRVGREIHVEVRDFLMVHGKGGQMCSICGGRISEVAPHRSRTNFCRGCQR